MGTHVTSKYFWRFCFCNGPVAFRNGILYRIGQPRAWVIGSESWKRSIARKVSDGVGVDGVGAKFPFIFGGVLQFPRSRRLRDNRQQLPGNVQKTLKSLETNKKKRKTKKNKEKLRNRKQEKCKKLKWKKERKTTSKMQTRQRNEKKEKTKKEIHSNPIYTNAIKNFPNRGNDLVRISIANKKKYLPQNIAHYFFCRSFWCNVIIGPRNPRTTPTKSMINIASAKLGVVRILPFS